MFLIRADGNAKIGAGHLMRCMTVAEELAALQGRDAIRFICADQASAELVRENGFQAHVLNTDYREPEQEPKEWRKLFDSQVTLDSGGVPLILVDSYFVTDRYLSELRELGYVVLMDDMGQHAYPVDCVVNYNAPATLGCYRELYRDRDVKLLVGSSFVPIRHQFVDTGYRVRENAKNVLITTGGGDSENIAGKILEGLHCEDMEFYVVAGRFHPHVQDLNRFAKCRDNVHICHDVKDMAGLMARCDVAVTAGGSTVYELASVGVPFICFSYAENQEPLTEYIKNSGVACEAGAWHRDTQGTMERIKIQFSDLIRDGQRREMLSRSERSITDGLGAARLAGELIRCKEWRGRSGT